MRSDIFESKKCVHIKLQKDLHTSLREKLVKHNITMQDIFQDLAESIVNDSSRAERLIQKITNKKLKAAIEGKTPKKESRKMIISELDSNTLYSLLEEAERNSENEE